MSLIDINCLSKAAFNSIFSIEKHDMTFDQIGELKLRMLYSIIDNANIMLNYTDIKNKEIAMSILKDALALCYIYNINLNNCISANINDEDNQPTNTRTGE